MASLQQAPPTIPTDRPYDPEIQELSNYIHNYKVDSDLAVSYAGLPHSTIHHCYYSPIQSCIANRSHRCSTILPASSSSILWDVVWKL